MSFDAEAIVKELTFKAVRSSGSGGQNVNKVASKVELHFNLEVSDALDDLQKERLKIVLSNKLSKEGLLILQCEESRSQHKNKELVVSRFLELIKASLIIPKKRKKTKIPKSVIQKRLKSKQKLSNKKALRKKPDTE